jgi:hypothetical protein
MNKKQYDADDSELFKSRGVAFKEVDAVIGVYNRMFTIIRLGNAHFFESKVA